MLKRFFLFILLLVFASCSGGTIAEVDGEKVSRKEYRRLKALRAGELKKAGVEPDPGAFKKDVINELIERKLILRGAAEKKVEITDQMVKDRIDGLKAEKGEAAFARLIKESGFRDERELRAVLREDMAIESFRLSFSGIEDVTYDHVLEKFKEIKPVREPMRVTGQVIEVAERDKAEKVARDVRDKGVPAAKKAYGADPGVVFLQAGQFNPEFFSRRIADSVKDSGPGDVLGPIPGKGKGWYVIKVEKIIPPVYASFESVKEKLMFSMIEERRSAQFANWLTRRKESASIRIRENLL